MMAFPVYLHLGGLQLHPHVVFESLAYLIGFRLYLLLRNRRLAGGGASMPQETAVWIIAGAAVGAALGSKILDWFLDPGVFARIHQLSDLSFLADGKTIVGGLLGGLIGVEWMKKKTHWSAPTGDELVFPLIVAISIGRIGCFLTGLADDTYGVQTNWITGVDFGDGIPRHPTQLYEIAFLLCLGACLLFLMKKKPDLPSGTRFQLFMISYLLFRLCVDFIKPTPHPYFGLNNAQAASLAGLLYYRKYIRRWVSTHLNERKDASA
ncbi:MAG: prolipoprotein diacylglyceryl transferase [Bacilli bacterium]|nr:prolipoprotein diacylglyceryl transferase [Bacilli bacterium]